MRIQERSRRFITESAFQVLARAQELEAGGREVMHLEIGQPDFPTPQPICAAAIQAIREGKTGYSPSPGLPELRRLIAADAGSRRGLEIRPEQVIVTPGGKPVLFYTINSLAGEGDEVVYPDPCFPMYPSIIAYSGARGVALRLREEKGFRFDAGEFRKLLSPRTRLVILNSPHNPTGAMLHREDFEVIAEEAKKRNFAVLSDEIYSNILYGEKFLSIASLPGMAERTVILDGFSKTYSMTGWRCGYALVPPPLAPIFDQYNVNIVSCVTTFVQYGAMEALRMDQRPVVEMVEEFRARRDLLVEGLNRLPGVRCPLPGGAFYAFPNIAGTGMSSRDLAGRLLEEAGVATLSGASFGAGGEGYLRLSYANSRSNLRKAIERIESFLRRG
ncbi:MAG: pyridoxal phosphate-dependent aminotransferase [Planctomycetes bacterium]|nr:pyridoxal phosphate-dependent aminotransferase [Planctomycetota bacterium]